MLSPYLYSRTDDDKTIRLQTGFRNRKTRSVFIFLICLIAMPWFPFSSAALSSEACTVVCGGDRHQFVAAMPTALDLPINDQQVSRRDASRRILVLDQAIDVFSGHLGSKDTQPCRGLRRFTENDLMGYRDCSGVIVIPARYDYADNFHFGMAWVAIPERREWCRIDQDGTLHSQTCQCNQPLIVYDQPWALDVPDTDDCYAAGLNDVRTRIIKRGRGD